MCVWVCAWVWVWVCGCACGVANQLPYHAVVKWHCCLSQVSYVQWFVTVNESALVSGWSRQRSDAVRRCTLPSFPSTAAAALAACNYIPTSNVREKIFSVLHKVGSTFNATSFPTLRKGKGFWSYCKSHNRLILVQQDIFGPKMFGIPRSRGLWVCVKITIYRTVVWSCGHY